MHLPTNERRPKDLKNVLQRVKRFQLFFLGKRRRLLQKCQRFHDLLEDACVTASRHSALFATILGQTQTHMPVALFQPSPPAPTFLRISRIDFRGNFCPLWPSFGIHTCLDEGYQEVVFLRRPMKHLAQKSFLKKNAD